MFHSISFGRIALDVGDVRQATPRQGHVQIPQSPCGQRSIAAIEVRPRFALALRQHAAVQVLGDGI